MSNHHFHRSAGPFTISLSYYFISIPFGSRQRFLHLRSRNLNNHHFHRSAGPFTVLLFYYFISIRFQAEVFASRVAKPECRTTIFPGRPDSPRVFVASRTTNPTCGLTFLHVGQTYPSDRHLLLCLTKIRQQAFGLAFNPSMSTLEKQD